MGKVEVAFSPTSCLLPPHWLGARGCGLLVCIEAAPTKQLG